MDKIKDAQKNDKEIKEMKEKMSEGKMKEFHENKDGMLWFGK